MSDLWDVEWANACEYELMTVSPFKDDIGGGAVKLKNLCELKGVARRF